LGTPPLREGLEGKNQSFRVSRGLEKEERKEKNNIYINAVTLVAILYQILTHICHLSALS
jgi:hypothetical protein